MKRFFNSNFLIMFLLFSIFSSLFLLDGAHATVLYNSTNLSDFDIIETGWAVSGNEMFFDDAVAPADAFIQKHYNFSATPYAYISFEAKAQTISGQLLVWFDDTTTLGSNAESGVHSYLADDWFYYDAGWINTNSNSGITWHNVTIIINDTSETYDLYEDSILLKANAPYRNTGGYGPTQTLAFRGRDVNDDLWMRNFCIYTNVTDECFLVEILTPQINNDVQNFYNTTNISINLNTTTNTNMSYYLDNSSEIAICNNCNSTILNLTSLNESSYDIIFESTDENGQVNTTANFTIDLTPPTIINNILAEYNSYILDFNSSCSDLHLDYCNITLNNQTIALNSSNFTSTLNGNITYIINAADLAGNHISTSGVFLINPINYIYVQLSNGTQLTNYTLNNVTVDENPYNFTHYDFGLGSQTLLFEKVGYISKNISFTLNTTNQLNLTLNVSNTNIVVMIYDRTTGVLLNTTTVTINIFGVVNGTTNTGSIIFNSVDFTIGSNSIQAIAENYGTEQKDFIYDGQSNATINLYLLDETLNTTSTLYVPVTDEFDNIISMADVRLLEYDSSIFGFKEVSQCYTDSNGECRFLVEVGLKTYIITAQKTINGILYDAVSSDDGEQFEAEISGGEEILGRDIIRGLKLQITDSISVTVFYGLSITAPDNENDTITAENSTTITVQVPVSFIATDNLAYTVCVEVYRFTNTTMSSVIAPICTTGASGILPTSNIDFNKDYNYQIWVTAYSCNNDKVTFRKYYYYSTTSFFATMVTKHYVSPIVMFLWSILLGFSLYLRSITTWVYGAWSISILQLALFPGYLFSSATVLIILINWGVLYMSKRPNDTT